MGAKTVKLPPRGHVYKGTYTFRFKQRETLSSLVKPEPAYETIVDALTELGRTSNLLKVKHKGDNLEVTLKVVDSWHQEDYRAAVREFDALMATFNSLRLTELDTKGVEFSPVFYRLRHRLRRIRADTLVCPSGLQSLEYSARGSSSTMISDLDVFLTRLNACDTLVKLCPRPYQRRCDIRCVCWDEFRLKSPWDKAAEARNRDTFGKIAGIIHARRQRQKAVQVDVLGIITFGEMLRLSPGDGGPTTLPLEIVDLVMDFIGVPLSREALARAKNLAFDGAHLSIRARALKGMEREEFGAALEEWLVGEGFVYTPPPPPRSVEDEDRGEGSTSKLVQ